MNKHWQTKKIGDICKTGAGGTPLKSNKAYYEGGNIPWLMSGEINQGEIYKSKYFITKHGLKNSSAKLFPKDTVLIAMYGATAGQVGILQFSATTNQAICGILPNKSLLPKFIYYFFLFIKNDLLKLATGNAQPNISQIKIKNQHIPIISIAEQQRIVTILDKAFSAINKAKSNVEKNLKNTKVLFKSYLEGVFENKAVNWDKKEFGKVIITLTDYHANGSYEILKENVALKETEDFAWMVRSTDFENNFENNFRYIDENAYNFLKKSKVFGDEIIMSKIGNAGNVYLMPKLDRPCSLAMNLFLIRVDGEKAIPEYIYQYLKSKKGEVQIKSRLLGTATKTITKDNVRSIVIPFPPLKEQLTIIQKLNALSAQTNKLEVIYQAKINELDALKKSILQKAFSGKLTNTNINIDKKVHA